jgi:hypothetical protein
MGPAKINWEGGWLGERKIQPVKPLLGIKWETADWQRITLDKLYRNETITWLLDSLNTGESNGSSSTTRRDRSMDDAIKKHGSLNDLIVALDECQPLMGVLDENDQVWLPYKPALKDRDGVSRSSVDLVEIEFDNENGSNHHSLCWMCSISKSSTIQAFNNMIEMSKQVVEYVLLLPQLDTTTDKNGSFVNHYYCIGSSWTERNRLGKFVPSTLDPGIFQSWRVEEGGSTGDDDQSTM